MSSPLPVQLTVALVVALSARTVLLTQISAAEKKQDEFVKVGTPPTTTCNNNLG